MNPPTNTDYRDRAEAFMKDLDEIQTKHQIKLEPKLNRTEMALEAIVGVVDIKTPSGIIAPGPGQFIDQPAHIIPKR